MCVCVCCFVCRVLGVVCLRSLSLAVFTSLTYTHILAHTHTHIARTWKISRAHMYVAHYRNKHRPTHTHTPNNYTIVHSDALGVRLYCMRWKHGINPSLFYCWFVDAIWYTALIFVFIFFFVHFSLCVCAYSWWALTGEHPKRVHVEFCCFFCWCYCLLYERNEFRSSERCLEQSCPQTMEENHAESVQKTTFFFSLIIFNSKY